MRRLAQTPYICEGTSGRAARVLPTEILYLRSFGGPEGKLGQGAIVGRAGCSGLASPLLELALPSFGSARSCASLALWAVARSLRGVHALLLCPRFCELKYGFSIV